MSRRGRGGVDDDGNDDEWDGSESERELEQVAFERRGVLWAGNRLQIIKRMYDKNLRTYSLLASSCLVIFQIHAESLFFHLINVEKSLAQQLGLVVSTNDKIVQSLLSASL